MEQKLKIPSIGKKETLPDKAGRIFENVKGKMEVKAGGFINKAKEKETELAEKAKVKVGDLKTGTKNLFNKVTDKFPGKK